MKKTQKSKMTTEKMKSDRENTLRVAAFLGVLQTEGGTSKITRHSSFGLGRLARMISKKLGQPSHIRAAKSCKTRRAKWGWNWGSPA